MPMAIVMALTLMLTVAAQATPNGFTEKWTVIHAGTLLAVPGEEAKRRQSVIIAEGRIVEVRPGFVNSSTTGGGVKTQLVDLSNSFVMPGLIDAHTHITHSPSRTARLEKVMENDADVALTASVHARVTLEAGFTTIRDVGASGHAIFAVRDAIDRGGIAGPRILAAGETITATGGHGDMHGYRADVLKVLASGGVCDGADDCRQAVREQIKRGADLIKVMATGGAASETATGVGVQMTEEELRVVVQTANALGRKVAAHAHAANGVKAALRAGVDSIEHGTWADRDEEIFQLFKESGAYLVPTAYLIEYVGDTKDKVRKGPWGYQPPEVLEKVFEIVLPQQPRVMTRAAHAAGVKIALGTDAGLFAHGDNARELIEYVRIGMTEMEALQAGTVNGAELLGLSDEVGTIESGKAGDIIATAKSPLEDISEMTRVTFVMKGGQVFKRPKRSAGQPTGH